MKLLALRLFLINTSSIDHLAMSISVEFGRLKSLKRPSSSPNESFHQHRFVKYIIYLSATMPSFRALEHVGLKDMLWLGE